MILDQRIQRLDAVTANQIAAGEVIERPVSVVKELVENALDAGSNRIQVEIREGGLEQICVTDNGNGILPEDMVLAVERHATSKLTVIQDLDSLTTLGFRGEALASIASVSNLTLTSRFVANTTGCTLNVKGEASQPVMKAAGCPIGTKILVEELFFNTPARLKFMKSVGYEGGLVHDLMIQMALGYPHVDFRLDSQGKTILDTAGVNAIEDLIELFYGKAARTALAAVQGQVSQAEVSGYLTAPPYSKGTRKSIHLFINGRRVVSKEIQWAIERSYEYLLPRGRFPVAVLRFDLPGALLDVNVHPAKLEVRINDPQLYAHLTHKIREAISGGQTMPDFSSYGQMAASSAAVQAAVKPSLQTFNEITPQWFKNTASPAEAAHPSEPYWMTDPGDRQKPGLQGLQALEHLEPFSLNTGSGVGPAAHTAALKAFAGGPVHPEDFVFDQNTPFQVIGQLHHTFILAETAAGLIMIDQHVAHERVLYEKLLSEHQDALIPAQMLLTPLPLHLTDAEEDALVRNIMVLSDLGMIVERFGPREYILRSAPAGQTDLSEAFFKDLLEQLAERPGAMRPEDVRQSLLIMMSCKGAVKANQPLTMKEMENLLMQLQQTRHPMTCPHGRPILYMLPYHRLLRAFGRSS